MKYLFGAAEFGRSFGETAWFIAVSMAVIFLTTGFQIWMEERYVPCTDPELYEKLNGMLFEQASNVDIACYEDVEFYDTYTKAASQAYERARSVLTDTAGMIAAFFASAYGMCPSDIRPGKWKKSFPRKENTR
ncbi:MAG: hypothetical protein HFH85_06055 [Lachnospiraceae bacterium]|jgi:ATP-binding cassette subfamily B protein|nr:hypothetical protein [Lachnospiraceae bacterium]